MSPRWAVPAAGALSGALYGLSLPHADLGWLAWVCLLPLAWLLLRPPAAMRSADLLRAGLAHGLVAGTFRVYWIAETLGRFGGLEAPAAIATTALLVGYLALYPVAFVALARRAADAWPSALPWLAAAIWTLLDWVQTWMISGFPWALLGTTQYREPLVVAFAALGGVHALTFILVAGNVALTQVLVGDRRLRRVGVACLLALGVSVVLWGLHHRRDLAAESGRPPLRLGIVQGNIGQDVKWDSGWQARTTRHYIDLTRRLAAEADRLDAIIWPETALPYRFDSATYAPLRSQVLALARDLQTPLLVGSLGTTSADGPGLYNRSFLIDARGRLVDSGDKAHLVPFGEYLPFPWFFGYLEELTRQSGAFDPGAEHTVLHWEEDGPGLGLFICYESIFPTIPRRLALDGADILVNTTNDAWFGTTAAPYQHFAMVVLRAVETGRAVVRAANTGISGAVDADGSVLRATGLFETTADVVEAVPRSRRTPYVRWGDAIVWLSALGLALAGGIAVVQRRRRVLSEIDEARQALEELARTPAPLGRPLVLLPGYDSHVDAMWRLRQTLAACFTDLEERLLPVDLRQDRPVAELARSVRESLPENEACDMVGHSLGGIVGALAARDVDIVEGRLVALASPFGGTWLARASCWLGYPLRRILRDLSPGSDALRGLARRVGGSPGFLGLRLDGDPVAMGLPDDGVRSLSMPHFVGPLRRHRAVHADPRALLAIVRWLRRSG